MFVCRSAILVLLMTAVVPADAGESGRPKILSRLIVDGMNNHDWPRATKILKGIFPAARYFIIGYGTNDLGTWPDTPRTSKRIIENLGQMVQAVTGRGKRPILFNVPYANESMFPPRIVEELHAKRDYHNARLKEYCDRGGVPLADICSRLRAEHFADELHPNGAGAKLIAEAVFVVLRTIHEA